MLQEYDADSSQAEAALASDRVASVEVVAFLPQVIDWLERGLFSTGPALAFLSSASVLCFAVSDACAARAALVARGATDERGATFTAKMPDHELWIAFVRDPDGNLIGLMEERP